MTEYKPTHGVVFAKYLASYSHWSYTDIDMLMGDLPLHVTESELSSQHIFTYHFGDVYRLYLRGQFAVHRNTPRVNRIWMACKHLSHGLESELMTKHAIVRKLAQQRKRGRTRFISAEGCYSHAVAHEPGIKVKFAAKALADWSDDAYFYVVSGAVRKCPRPSQVWPTDGVSASDAIVAGAAAGAAKVDEGEVVRDECAPFGPRVAPHSFALPGLQQPSGALLPLEIHSNCSRWVEKRFRLCAALSEEEAPLHNVFLDGSGWHAQRFTQLEPHGAHEGAFLHLQRWKAPYKRLAYGDIGMPLRRGRDLFRLSARGIEPLDLAYDDVKGASPFPQGRSGGGARQRRGLADRGVGDEQTKSKELRIPSS